MRAHLLKKSLYLGLATLAWLSGAACAADADSAVSLHGFVDSTFFWQNQNFIFGNGQDAEFAVPSAVHNDLTGGDLRNTRLWLDTASSNLPGGAWNAAGHVEMDFFGGFNGTGPYSSSQETPRLRQAYVTLDDGAGSSWRIGQQWDLIFPVDNLPESDAHIAFPLGFGSGVIGWRFPGVVYSQKLDAGAGDWRLDLGAFEGEWNGPGSNVNFGTAGNADFHPQVEGRLHVQNGDLLWYVAAHYSREDLSGVGGTAPTPVTDSISSYAYEGGIGWQPAPWVLRAGLYAGKGLGEVFGAMAQFGAISEWGGYVQGGYKFTQAWTLYAFYTTVRPNQGDVVTWVGPAPGNTGFLRNQQAGLDALYSNVPWGFGLEWMHAITRYTVSPTGASSASTVGDQVSASAIFHF